MAENGSATTAPPAVLPVWDVEWPLRGRESELAAVSAALRQRRGAVIAGPAGVGRTRLARHLRSTTAGRSGPGAWLAASEPARTVALGAFAPFLGGATRAGLHAAPEPDAAWTRPGDLHRAVAAVASRSPGLLCVDDAHLLDDASAALLHHLVLHHAVPVVVTMRTGQQHTAPGAVTALWKDGHLDRVDLAPLPADTVLELLEAAVGDQVERRSATRLRGLVGGNLALLRALVVAEAAAGRWQRVAGVWMWTAAPDPTSAVVTPRIADLLDAYVPAPSPAALRAAELVAVAGGTDLGLDLEVLERLTDPGAVEDAERSGLFAVARSGDAQVRLAVPLYGALLRDRLGVGRTRRLRAALAEAVLGAVDRPVATRPARTPAEHASADVARGLDALDRGRVRSAARLLRDAAAGFTRHGSAPDGWTAQRAMTELAMAQGMAGDAPAAAAALERAGRDGNRRRWLLAAAWTAAAAGTTSEAAALAQRAAVQARDDGATTAEVLALRTAVQFGDTAGAGRLAELAAAGDPDAEIAAAHAAALAAGDGRALEDVSGRWAERAALLPAADAAAQAATAHDRAGARTRAVAAAARAELLAQRCEGAVTPALRAAAHPLPLTAREREVTTLAALGLSNRQIAERLVVSVRTVEGHLYRACAKLHVASRAELDAMMEVN